MHIKAQTEIIMYHRFSDDFAAAKKCDVQTRACDKTKPNLYNPMRTIIVQRKNHRFRQNRPKIVTKSIVKLLRTKIPLSLMNGRIKWCPTACCGLVCNGTQSYFLQKYPATTSTYNRYKNTLNTVTTNNIRPNLYNTLSLNNGIGVPRISAAITRP